MPADPAPLRSSPRLHNQVVAAARERIASLALTRAERLVLHWFIATPHDKALATTLGKHRNTIRNQLASAIGKLSVETRAGLLIFLFTGERPWLGQNDYGQSLGRTIG